MEQDEPNDNINSFLNVYRIALTFILQYKRKDKDQNYKQNINKWSLLIIATTIIIARQDLLKFRNALKFILFIFKHMCYLLYIFGNQ